MELQELINRLKDFQNLFDPKVKSLEEFREFWRRTQQRSYYAELMRDVLNEFPNEQTALRRELEDLRFHMTRADEESFRDEWGAMDEATRTAYRIRIGDAIDALIKKQQEREDVLTPEEVDVLLKEFQSEESPDKKTFMDSMKKMFEKEPPTYPQDEEPNEYRYLSPSWIDDIAEGLTAGAKKHPGETWRQIPRREHLFRAMRHIVMCLAGDNREQHIINASMRLMMAYETDDLGESENAD